MAEHPGSYDVVVTGRPSQRWGQEVVAIVQLVEGRDPSDEELLETCQQHIARCKIAQGHHPHGHGRRSPAGKADYRWAKQVAAENLATTTGSD
ncbi:hypothetical protein H7K34_26170 [Mycobacterium montefiorense]|nr:hypothetical protein [Mycobacterium montefiorense]